MDEILITNLTVEAKIGVYDWEKSISQKIHIDLSIQADLRAAGRSDELEHSIDYSAIEQDIQLVVRAKHYQLVEHMAEEIAKKVCLAYPIDELKVKVTKPGALNSADSVSVVMTRNQRDYS